MRRGRLDPICDAQNHVRLQKEKALCVWRYIDPIKGRGVFALEPIHKGSFLLEYRGVLKKTEKTTAWNEYTYVFKHKGTEHCIDASSEDGTLGRLVNDAEKPNAKMKKIEVDGVPSLCLFAIVDIEEGQEITYDYGGENLPWRSYQRHQISKPLVHPFPLHQHTVEKPVLHTPVVSPSTGDIPFLSSTVLPEENESDFSEEELLDDVCDPEYVPGSESDTEDEEPINGLLNPTLQMSQMMMKMRVRRNKHSQQTFTTKQR
ncbi:histone-lysine N-methyltransferase, H3 lysine-36 specific-like isoform X5 [Etheostoma cragini]|uniref:histone-lysine N-methyltransferase, H3 lysine-36 specific-like isoform X5 n=1 Tax=Etheostoma cragini TaxID=417921 RepID=UPI00155E12B6|nr:histone-lysine N-methyltransferase, H3 lysine-36 specific-like isoform X5 [Etheostoma cragini]